MIDSNFKKQQDIAKNLYNNDPARAIRIATGEETLQDEILVVAIYTKVCEEIEKISDIDTSMRLANSLNNSKISQKAQHLKFRNPDSSIERMKEVVNARRKAFKKTLPKNKTYEMVVKEEVKKIKKEIEKVSPSQKDLEDFIDSISEDN